MKSFAIAASAIAVLGIALPMAQASSVSLDTYATSDGSGWTVVRTAPGNSADAQENVVDVNPVNSNWISALDVPYGNAMWVSDNAGSGNGTADADGTIYTYSNTFSLDFSTGSGLQITGEFAADNYVQSVDLYQGNTLVANLFTNSDSFAQKIYGFQAGIPLNGTAGSFDPAQSFTLQVTAMNDDGPGVDGNLSGPTGFILGGTAQVMSDSTPTTTVAAPLPEAAWMGMSLLSSIGGVSVIRKRLRRS